MKIFAIIGLILVAHSGLADTVVSTQVIRPKTVISADYLAVKAVDIPGTYTDIAHLVGLEARIAIYPGRPIRSGDVGPPALIDRNQTVTLIYQRGGLVIIAEARALDRAAAGETIRVMNLSSHTTVAGFVQSDGTVRVLQ